MDSKLIFSQIDIEDLTSLLSKRVKEDIVKELLVILKSQKQQAERPIDFVEAMQVLGMKERTLRAKVADGEIPHYKNGRKLSFFESELIAYIKTGKVKTDIEIQEEANTYLRKNKLDSIY